MNITKVVVKFFSQYPCSFCYLKFLFQTGHYLLCTFGNLGNPDIDGQWDNKVRGNEKKKERENEKRKTRKGKTVFEKMVTSIHCLDLTTSMT